MSEQQVLQTNENTINIDTLKKKFDVWLKIIGIGLTILSVLFSGVWWLATAVAANKNNEANTNREIVELKKSQQEMKGFIVAIINKKFDSLDVQGSLDKISNNIDAQNTKIQRLNEKFDKGQYSGDLFIQHKNCPTCPPTFAKAQ